MGGMLVDLPASSVGVNLQKKKKGVGVGEDHPAARLRV